MGKKELMQTYHPKGPSNNTQRKNDIIQTHSQSYSEDQITSSMAVDLSKDKFSGDMIELYEKIDTMMGRGENMVRNGTKHMIKAYVC